MGEQMGPEERPAARETATGEREILTLLGSRSLLMGARAVVAGAVLLWLGGTGRAWLPGLGLLALLLIGLHVFPAVVRGVGRKSAPAGERAWIGTLRTHWFGIGLIALAVAGAAYRIFDIGFDLGHVPVDIDEGRLAESVLHFFRTGDIDHTTVEHYPGIHFWVLTATYLATYLWALMSGAGSNLESIPLEQFVLAGRVTSSVLAVGTISVTGLLGRSIAGPGAGLLAAGVVAVSPLSVRVSTHLRNDETLVLLAMASAYAAVTLHVSERRLWAVVAGGLAGAATAVKYSGVFVLLPALVAAAVGWRGSERRVRLGLAVVSFGVTLAMTNHFLWADVPNFVRQLSDQIAITGADHWAATDNPARAYVTTIAEGGTGWPLLAAAVGLGVYGLVGRRPMLWVFLAFPLSYLWFMSKTPSQLPRWVYPLVPFVAIAGSATLWTLVRRVETWWRARRAAGGPVFGVATVAVVGLALSPLLWTATVDFSRRLTPPTHTLAEQWLQDHVSPSEVVLIPDGWLDLSSSGLRLHRVPNLATVLGAGRYQLYTHDWVVVPEPDAYDPNLSRLVPAQSILADFGFGGNLGADYRMYVGPVLAPIRAGTEFRLGDEESRPYLGLRWHRDDGTEPGLVLPATGASLFLPPIAAEEVAFRVTLKTVGEDAASSAQALPIALAMEGTPIPLTRVTGTPGEIELLSDPLVTPGLGSRISEVRLTPTTDGAIRVVTFGVR